MGQLRGAGVEPIATELAKRNLPLAGSLQYFARNWAKITQDQLVLEAVRGDSIPITQQPHQQCPPQPLHHSSASAHRWMLTDLDCSQQW